MTKTEFTEYFDATLAKVSEIAPAPSASREQRVTFLAALGTFLAKEIYSIAEQDLAKALTGMETICQSMMAEMAQLHVLRIYPEMAEELNAQKPETVPEIPATESVSGDTGF
jgi:hypothetical protein